MYGEHIDYEHHPLTEDSPEVLKARRNGTLGGEPISDPAHEVDRRAKAHIAYLHQQDTAETYSAAVRHVLHDDPVLSVRYLGAAGIVSDRVKQDPKLSSDDGRTLVSFAELLAKVDPRGGSMVEHLHRCLKYFPDLNRLYKAGQL
jgi:hypothetical protein